MNASIIQQELAALSSPDTAKASQRFFKTGPGQYGEGDVFRGIRVPVLRELSKKFGSVPLEEVLLLLRSSFHEDRLFALFLLIRLYAKGNRPAKEAIYQAYLAHTKYINNWDLVDSSAEHIVGAFLHKGDTSMLDTLSQSASLWERRISIIATFHYIKKKEFSDAFRIAEKLLHDPEDLMHKAVGWMLREIGKRNQEAEEEFLRAHYKGMPRTMLRYAIEKFPESLRQSYLQGKE